VKRSYNLSSTKAVTMVVLSFFGAGFCDFGTLYIVISSYSKKDS